MSPGLAIEKHVLSSSDLGTSHNNIHSYSPEEVVAKIQQTQDFQGKLKNPISGKEERILDLICFKSEEVI